ncbi:MAG: ribosome maturation factor RimM [Bifidobacteriaceae bacterium]|nr:ribosome maturation factor RimM [Bifidobacteriaceae bacterium]
MIVAVVGRAHGVKGDVTLDLRTDRPENRFQIGSSYALDLGQLTAGENLPARLTLERFRADNGRAVAGFAEVADRSRAESLRGAKLLAEVRTDEEPEAWYPTQLRGAAVVLPDGTSVGRLIDLVALPGQDLLEIEQPDGSTALVPFVKALVPEVDPDRGRIVIDPPAGLVSARPSGEGN